MNRGSGKTVAGIVPRSDNLWWSRPLPTDLVDRSIARMRTLAVVVGGVFGLGMVGTVVLEAFGWFSAYEPTTMIARAVVLAASIVMYAIARSRRWSRQLKSDVGLAYEVIVAFALAFTEMVLLPFIGIHVGWVSGTALWIVLVRMLIPTTTLRATVAAALSGATIFVAIWVAGLAGAPPVEPLVYSGLGKSTFLAVVCAVLASRAVYRLGSQVAEARDMGSYRLRQLIGSGGMGEVWRADHRMLHRPAAVKLIRPEVLAAGSEVDHDTLLQRFEREAKTTAKLHSVHTVELFDFGPTEDGSFYYAMELLDGVDLEYLVEHYGPVPPERVAFILQQICHSLMDAHEHGLFHRDIKPSNIFLCRMGPDHDFIKVLDFGLVKQKSALESPEVRLTEQGMAPGTPGFMAPEVALGGDNVGPHTDLYMVGCVAYLLLTGEPVFEGNTVAAVVSSHIKDDPVPVSLRSEFEIPPKLEELISDCLQKDPAMRPQSAAAIRTSILEAGLADAWTQQRAARWWDLHKPASRSPEEPVERPPVAVPARADQR
jgi:serine/threonine-protein kinase